MTPAVTKAEIAIAELSVKVDSLVGKMDIYLIKFDKHLDKFDRHLELSAERDKRIAVLETIVSGACENLEKTRNEVDTIKKRSYIWEGINSFVIVVLGALGISKQ